MIPETMLVKILPTHILHLGGIKSTMKARKIFLWNVRTLAHASVMMLNLAVNTKSEIQTEKIILLQYILLKLVVFRSHLDFPAFFTTPSCHFIICCIKQIINYGLLWKTFNRQIPTYSRVVKELMMLLFSFIHNFSLIQISGFMISLIDSPRTQKYQSHQS